MIRDDILRGEEENPEVWMFDDSIHHQKYIEILTKFLAELLEKSYLTALKNYLNFELFKNGKHEHKNKTATNPSGTGCNILKKKRMC